MGMFNYSIFLVFSILHRLISRTCKLILHGSWVEQRCFSPLLERWWIQQQRKREGCVLVRTICTETLWNKRQGFEDKKPYQWLPSAPLHTFWQYLWLQEAQSVILIIVSFAIRLPVAFTTLVRGKKKKGRQNFLKFLSPSW